MIEVYYEVGLKDREKQAICSSLIEDERYLILVSDGKTEKIPHSRVTKIVEISEKDKSSTLKTELKIEVPKEKKKFTLSDLKEVAAVKKKGKREKSVDVLRQSPSEDLVQANVIISGVEHDNFQVNVPKSELNSNKYSAVLATILSKNVKMKTMLERGNVYDGVPTVINGNIHVKTKSLTSNVAGVLDKVNMVSKISDAVKKFKKPEGVFPTDFSMNEDENQFAITGSPWDGPVKLNQVGDNNAHSEQKGGVSERAVESEVSDGEPRL